MNRINRTTSVILAILCTLPASIAAHAGEPAAPEATGSKSQQLKAACARNPDHPICQELARKAAARKAARDSKIQAKIDAVLGAVQAQGKGN